MKRFDDLTNEEVLALTPEAIQWWTDLECAHVGAPLLPPEPVRPEVVDYEPDLSCFVVGEYVFRAADPAAELLALLERLQPYRSEYVSGPSCHRKLGRHDDYNAPKIITDKFFSIERWDEIKVKANAAATAKQTYEKEKREWDKIVKDRERVSNYISDRIEEIITAKRTAERLSAQFERYLGLAGGNRAIACKFMLDANPTAKDDAPELFKEEAA